MISRTSYRTAHVVIITALLGFSMPPDLSHSDPAGSASIEEMLARECTNLNKERLFSLLKERFGAEWASGIDPVLFKIMEGVIKRTDFDGIPEAKTVEIVELVSGAYRKGAPLEFLDDIFDVAYVNTISVDQLAAAAGALKDFHNSDVPRDVYEEFVYHSIENGWEPAVVPVLTRGLIYGVDRGLTPEKVALIIMLDVKNGELKTKQPDQLVLDAVKLVREKEPGKWKPLTKAELDAEASAERARALERKRQSMEEEITGKERAFIQAQNELRQLREYPSGPGRDIDQEKLNRDLEALIRKLQGEISAYQNQHRNIVAQLETTRKSMQRQQDAKAAARQQKRDRDLGRAQQEISGRGRSGRLDRDKLLATVVRWTGTPYRFGGDSERGIDCSAFTRRVYRVQGVELPRTSRDQARVGTAVGSGNIRAGDLIFFNTSINGVISHVGIYLGNNVFAHASSSKGVGRSSLKEQYYAKRLVKAGRIFND